ncbi:MAG TPA: hypothetical protein VFO83_03705 [Aggregicoccus sp.]|nr:hypothetical protein [Aggregicoccus sp.]
MTDREQTEKAADRIREEFLLTLQELDRRRDHALDVGYQVRQHRDAFVIAGSAVALLALAGVGVGIYRRRHREERLFKRRLEGIRRAWSHPERLASSREEKPLAIEMGTKLVVIFGTALATSLAKRSVTSLVPPQGKKVAFVPKESALPEARTH